MAIIKRVISICALPPFLLGESKDNQGQQIREGYTMKTIYTFIFCFLSFFSTPVNAQTPTGSEGIYRSGTAPLNDKAKVSFVKVGTTYEIIPNEPTAQPWRVSFERIRGAVATEKGLWFYWFDETNNVLNAYFEMPNPSMLAN